MEERKEIVSHYRQMAPPSDKKENTTMKNAVNMEHLQGYVCEGDLSEWMEAGFVPLHIEGSDVVLASKHLLVKVKGTGKDERRVLALNEGTDRDEQAIEALVTHLLEKGLVRYVKNYLLLVPNLDSWFSGPFESFGTYLESKGISEKRTRQSNGSFSTHTIETLNLRLTSRHLDADVMREVLDGEYDAVYEIVSIMGYREKDKKMMDQMDMLYAADKIQNRLPLKKVTVEEFHKNQEWFFRKNKIRKEQAHLEILEALIKAESLFTDLGEAYRILPNQEILDIAQKKGEEFRIEDVYTSYQMPKGIEREEWHEGEVLYLESLGHETRFEHEVFFLSSLADTQAHVKRVLEDHVRQMTGALRQMEASFDQV